jgi:hypothetical protein
VSDHIPTLADVCCAIAEGRVSATLDGDLYSVNALELRRYFNKSRPLSSTAQPPAATSNADQWSTTSSQISVA